MVNKEETLKVIANAEKEDNDASYSMTPEEMGKFKVNEKLPSLISAKKMENDLKHKVTATKGYGLIEEMCLISETSLKKTNGSMIQSSMPISLLAGILQDSVIRPIFMNLHC